ncbi:hypothetical protein SDC9_78543 [bioreactor metagenome]|uniref:Uncharacterized protein n=1 Tax=bioreactor metagenome TaxID=1076179 RepID=A0A644YTZ2_9ZZZZ
MNTPVPMTSAPNSVIRSIIPFIVPPPLIKSSINITLLLDFRAFLGKLILSTFEFPFTYVMLSVGPSDTFMSFLIITNGKFIAFAVINAIGIPLVSIVIT